eukprot:CAMPEP_0196665696 /NCGR_PEP_ID=MMETSP1086-20130531/62220_1 /TAXON_ID=77921 /ORGANISM="Cyanoptyche  gloeocystis , Strain SAG4.97" /LENGTH=65 /DNA_ID=CAMNT_0042002589 /DNA_START=67 /DNA_END=262 /DNA_ORIENTATION=-
MRVQVLTCPKAPKMDLMSSSVMSQWIDPTYTRAPAALMPTPGTVTPDACRAVATLMCCAACACAE